MSDTPDIDSAIDWMEDAALELTEAPLARPELKEETIRTHVHQVEPRDIDGKIRFFTRSPGPIIMAHTSVDPDKGQLVHKWEQHPLDKDPRNPTKFHTLGPYFCDVPRKNPERLRPARIAKRTFADVVIFGDDHAAGDPAFAEGYSEPVHPTLEDALGYLRAESNMGIKGQYKDTFKELDRDAANLLALLYNAINVNVYNDPKELSDKLFELTSRYNLQQLIGVDRALYWQRLAEKDRNGTQPCDERKVNIAEKMQIKSKDFSAAEGKGPTSRFTLGLQRFKDALKALHGQTSIHYVDETKDHDHAAHLQKAYKILFPLFELTHPYSSVVASLLYSPEGKTTQTGRNLCEFHYTVRRLLRYFGQEHDPQTKKSFADLYKDTWGEFESQLRSLSVPQFIQAAPWKPLCERGISLTITATNLEATLAAANAANYQTVVPPIPLGPGRFGRFKDDQGYQVGLWMQNKKL